MHEYYELRDLVQSLSSEQVAELKMASHEDDQYSRVLEELLNKKLPEYLMDEKRSEKLKKSKRNSLRYLEDKILELFGQSEISVEVQRTKELNQILFLLHQSQYSIALRKAKVLMKKVQGTEMGWIGVMLLDRFFDYEDSFGDVGYVNALRHYANQFAGLNTAMDKKPKSGFLTFIEEFRRTSVGKLEELDKTRSSIERSDEYLSEGIIRLKEQVKFLNELQQIYDFIWDQDINSVSTEKILLQCRVTEYRNNTTKAFYSVLAHYMEFLMYQQNLLLRVMGKPINEFKSIFELDSFLEEDLIYRIEICKVLILLFGYDKTNDRNHEKLGSIRKRLVKINSTIGSKNYPYKVDEELIIFLKTIHCVVSITNPGLAGYKTSSKYRLKIELSEIDFYIDCANGRWPQPTSGHGYLQNVLSRYIHQKISG